MDIDEPRTPKLADMRPRGPHNHLCKVCAKNFRSGRALGGHMSCHRHAGMEASANANGDHQHKVMLFSPVKRKRSKRVMPVLNSEVCAAAALLMLAEYSDKSSAFEDCHGGDNNDNISTPNLLKEVDLNAFDQTVHCDEFMNNTRPKSDKNSAYAGLYELSDKENSLNLGSELMKPEADILVEEVKCGNLSVAANIKRYQCKVCRKLLRSRYALGVHMRLHLEKENNLNLVADVPKEVLQNVFDPGLTIDAEIMKPGGGNSVEDLKSGDLSAAVIKSYPCKVCGKLLKSGRALGGHMTSHLLHGQENTLNLVVDVPKTEVPLNVFDHELDADAEFMKPGADNSVEDLKFGDLSAAANIKSYPCKVCGKLLKSGRSLGGHMTSHHGKENTLNLVADVPKTEVLLNVFDHGLDADDEFMKPGADISVEELKSSDLSAATNVKRHQCKVSGKLLRSGIALGGHMRLHYVRKSKNLQQGVADCPISGLMEEHMQKLELDSPIFCQHRPHSHGSEFCL